MRQTSRPADPLPVRPRNNRYSWLWEQFEERGDYARRAMFGCQAVYLSGKLMFAVTDRQEPWNGLLCATDRPHHDALRADFPVLTPHPILGKWLYLSAASDGFEEYAQGIADAIARGDVRFGVEPSARKRRDPSSSPAEKQRSQSDRPARKRRSPASRKT